MLSLDWVMSRLAWLASDPCIVFVGSGWSVSVLTVESKLGHESFGMARIRPVHSVGWVGLVRVFLLDASGQDFFFDF